MVHIPRPKRIANPSSRPFLLPGPDKPRFFQEYNISISEFREKYIVYDRTQGGWILGFDNSDEAQKWCDTYNNIDSDEIIEKQKQEMSAKKQIRLGEL